MASTYNLFQFGFVYLLRVVTGKKQTDGRPATFHNRIGRERRR
jgi:hypothetical protein